jgi:fumarylacetoacetase
MTGNSTMTLNRTHDAARKSFVATANEQDCDFPLQNLPLGVFQGERSGHARCGIRIGDQILDLPVADEAGLLGRLPEAARQALRAPSLMDFVALGSRVASELRAVVFDLLVSDQPEPSKVGGCLVAAGDVEMLLPLQPRNFTDFLTSRFHKLRLSANGAIDPNFRSLPLAYHSRASSVRVSGTEVRRPHVQRADKDGVDFGPSREVDFELELGAFIGSGNPLGQPIPVGRAAEQVFGYCLLNDWSIRDIQRWESLPLGPFLAKSLMTSISPWIVSREALLPFRTSVLPKPADEAPLLPYLVSSEDQSSGSIDLRFEVWLRSARERSVGGKGTRITITNFKHMSWTFAQMIAHHASNGCNLLSGDLLGSGTISGPDADSRACMAEITERGEVPVSLGSGEERRWLEDGDEVTFTARASKEGFASIGFGECSGVVAPAVPWPLA